MVKAGSVFLNATLTALNQGPSVNPLLLNLSVRPFLAQLFFFFFLFFHLQLFF